MGCYGGGGAPVDEMGGGVESFDPELRWKVGVNEEDTNNIVGGTEVSFSFPVFARMCMGKTNGRRRHNGKIGHGGMW